MGLVWQCKIWYCMVPYCIVWYHIVLYHTVWTLGCDDCHVRPRRPVRKRSRQLQHSWHIQYIYCTYGCCRTMEGLYHTRHPLHILFTLHSSVEQGSPVSNIEGCPFCFERRAYGNCARESIRQPKTDPDEPTPEKHRPIHKRTAPFQRRQEDDENNRSGWLERYGKRSLYVPA